MTPAIGSLVVDNGSDDVGVIIGTPVGPDGKVRYLILWSDCEVHSYGGPSVRKALTVIA